MSDGLKQIEKAMRAGVTFEAVDPNDGRAKLFIWHCGDNDSAMGFETIAECAADVCRELSILK